MDETSGSLNFKPNTNIRKTDIIFELKPKLGGAKTDTGLLDKKLFTGGNRLHAIMNSHTCLWHLRYEDGVLPQPLQQQFTSFRKLHEYVKNYFTNRNVEITNIID